MPRSVQASGRPRSYITLPEYRKGKKPANFGKKYPAEVLTAQEVRRLLAECSASSDPTAVRNRALIVVLWRAGLRIEEALDLLPKDVDLDAGTIAILHGKGDRRRIVGVDPQALGVLRDWLRHRAQLDIDRSCPLFCVVKGPTRGKKMWDSTVRETFKDLARKAGIEKRVHPHGFRHTHAAELAKEGVPVHVIRRQLGHADLAMTQRYIDHLTPLDVIAAMQQRAWEATHELLAPVDGLRELERGAATGGPAGEHRQRSRPATAAAAL